MEKNDILTILVSVTLILSLANLAGTYRMYGKFIDLTDGSDGTIPSADVGKLAPDTPNPPSGVRNTISVDDDPVKGDANAPVTIVEFSDFQCPFCARWFTDTFPQLNEKYIKTGKVKLVFRDFPLSFHENAQKAAEASECADEQGKFWEMHDKLFQNAGALGVTNLKQYAADLKLDTAKFNTCLDTGKFASEVQKDMADGSSYGVSGTPAFFINGVNLVGAQPFSAFDVEIQAALAGKPSPGAAPSPSAPPLPPSKVVASVDDDPMKGEKNAKVTIIEFSDFQCPFCARFYTQTLPQLEKEYISTGKAKLVFRDLPLSFHENAQKAAEASECADDQGKFWEYHDKLFDNQGALAVTDLKKYAADLKLDQTKFDACLDTGKYTAEVKKDEADAGSYGLSGTPSFIINGNLLVGAQPFSAFKQIIDAELAK